MHLTHTHTHAHTHSESRGSLLPEQVLALASGLLPGVPQAQLDYLRAMLAEAGGRASASGGGRTSFAALCDAVRAGADAAALAARRAALRSRAVSGRGASVGGAEDALWRVSLRLQVCVRACVCVCLCAGACRRVCVLLFGCVRV